MEMLRWIVGIILGILAITGLVFSLMVAGGPNAHYLTDHPAGPWIFLPYLVCVLFVAAWLLMFGETK